MVDINDHFRETFMYAKSRSGDVFKIKEQSLGYVKSEGLRVEYRFSALVVYLYKCIETNDSSGIVFGKEWGDENKKVIEDNIDVRRRGIRDDPMQVYISYLTARWHSLIFIGLSPVEDLKRIESLVQSDSPTKPTYSQNVGKSLLLLCYIVYLNGDVNSFKRALSVFYSYYVKVVGSLDTRKPIGASHFGDTLKCASALQSALGGAECVDGKRQFYSLWSPEKVVELSTRVKEDDFRKRFCSYLKSIRDSDPPGGVNHDEADSYKKLVCIGVRYSLYDPGSKGYHLAHDGELYKKNLFSRERMEAREKIFSLVTLPSLRMIREVFGFEKVLAVIVISKGMPYEYKKRLEKLVEKDDFVKLVEQEECEVDVNSALLKCVAERLSDKETLVATSRLDDDDALSAKWFENLLFHVTSSNVGKILTFPKGVTAFYDNQSDAIIAAVEVNARNIGLGLSNVIFYNGSKFSHNSIYKQGNHMNVMSEQVFLSGQSFFRVINSFRDKNYSKGARENRLRKDLNKYLKSNKRIVPDLSEFGVSLPILEVDDFVAIAKVVNRSLVVSIKEDTLSEKYQDYKVALYFMRGNEVLVKRPYRKGCVHRIDDESVVDEADFVKVYLRRNGSDERASIKVSVDRG